MPNADAFARRMRTLGEQIEANATAAVKRIALAVDQAVVLHSPVDTGRFRANWRVALDEPVEDEIEAYHPGENGSTAAANAQEAFTQAEGVIAQYRLGQTIWISNPLPQGPALNNGSSAQAPAGFVETAVHQGVEAIRQAQLLKD